MNSILRRLRGEGLVWLIESTVSLVCHRRVITLPPLEMVKRCWSRV